MNNEPLSVVSNEEFERIYQTIKEDFLEGKSPVENPFMVVLGGQPGSGKGNIYRMYQSTVTDNFVTVNCDDFREYHPHFKELFQKYGDADSDYTQKFVGDVSKRLVRELSAEGYNMIFESTLNNPNVALSIRDQLKPLGYQVELCVISTNKEVSLQSTIDRKEEMIREGKQPRGVTPEYHDYVCEHICDALSTLYESGKMDNIRIFTRNADCLYDYSVTPELSPTPILEARLNNPEEAANKLITEYISTAKLQAALDQLNDPEQFNKFLQLQGGMYTRGTDTALEFFSKGRTFRLSTHDWRMSEVPAADLKKELGTPDNESVAAGMTKQVISKQSIESVRMELGVPEQDKKAFAMEYVSTVTAMIKGRLEPDKLSSVKNSVFSSLDTKQKLSFLEHCREDTSKAIDKIGMTIENMTKNNPIRD